MHNWDFIREYFRWRASTDQLAIYCFLLPSFQSEETNLDQNESEELYPGSSKPSRAAQEWERPLQ